jgi:hypothetical protein
VTFHPTLRARLTQHFPIRQAERDARYLATYKLFLRFFKERIAVSDLQADDAKAGVVFVYSWMAPAEFKPECWNHFALAKKVLKRDKDGPLSAVEVDALKSFVGGSLIATSKFLHFFNPNRYAIWDTNVARVAYRYSWKECNRSQRYIEYLNDIKQLELSAALRKRVHDVIGRCSAMRCKEFALFQLGVAETTPPSNAAEVNIADFEFASEKYTLDLAAEYDSRDEDT